MQNGNFVCFVKERDCEENVQAVVEYLRKQGCKVVENQGELPIDTVVIFNVIGEVDEIENKLQVIDITDFTGVLLEYKTPELGRGDLCVYFLYNAVQVLKRKR